MMKLNGLICIFLIFLDDAKCYKMRLSMPYVTPEHDDIYLCSSFKISNYDKESYIKSYRSTTNSSVAHHILLYGCNKPYSREPYYSCIRVCENGDEKIIFAWAKDAQQFNYPADTGMAVGGETGINYLVLQVHYIKKMKTKDNSGMEIEMSYDPPSHLVSIALVFSYYGNIPSNTEHVNMDISCSYRGKIPAYPLAFRIHTHKLGRSVSGFRVSGSNGQIDLIGKGNPQWPQTFYKANSDVVIMPRDVLMVRCVFDSSGTDHVTKIGSTHQDEMCNFYIMLVSKNSDTKLDFTSCGGNEFQDLWKNVPDYSKQYGAPQPDPTLMLFNQKTQRLLFNPHWKVDHPLGEVSSVAVFPESLNSSRYSLIVFHRGDHYWKHATFKDNVYMGNPSPISSDTILNIDPETGKVLRKCGANMFFMPHGVTVTKDGKQMWVTDVALHQVMRFTLLPFNNPKMITETPDIILGEKLVPGNDRRHFCKPTKVAVDGNGFIFVADGYCNSRIMCFYPNGTYADEWRTKDMMLVVHSITIDEDKSGDIKKNVVWVADRENQRIVGFKYDGSVVSVSSSVEYGMPIFAIEFNSLNRLLYGVSSNGLTDGDSFLVDYKSNDFSQPWHSNYTMKAPHDLCLAEAGSVIFVAELHLKTVLRFSLVASARPPRPVADDHALPVRPSTFTMTPTIIGLATFLAISSLVFCVFLLRLCCRLARRDSRRKRYGSHYKDKEGFEPLAQTDDVDNGADSDPEAEEFSDPGNRVARKPKV